MCGRAVCPQTASGSPCRCRRAIVCPIRSFLLRNPDAIIRCIGLFVTYCMDFSTRKLLCLALLAGFAAGCGHKPTGEAAFEKGLAYYKDENFPRAAACFEDALASMHTNALALN